MIKLLGPSQYCNLKADMLSRNKIDAVNFELNNIDVKYEELLNLELNVIEQVTEKENGTETKKLVQKVYIFESSETTKMYNLKLDGKIVEITRDIVEYDENGLQKLEFKKL